MMEAMSDIVWAINTRNDKLDNLVNRMRGFAVQVSEAKEFELHFAENKDLPDMPLDMYERKNLYLIFKEAVNNAAKYAECKNLWIEFSNKSRVLEMKIKDDGKGFALAAVSLLSKQQGGGNGLLNMKKRATDLRGELHVISAEGQGTEVLLRMKL
jgi:signal transduction histidine kinase